MGLRSASSDINNCGFLVFICSPHVQSQNIIRFEGGGGGEGGVVTEDFVSHRDFVVSYKFVILRSTHWL